MTFGDFQNVIKTRTLSFLDSSDEYLDLILIRFPLDWLERCHPRKHMEYFQYHAAYINGIVDIGEVRPLRLLIA